MSVTNPSSAPLLPLETFTTVVANTPLVSIDLVVKDKQSKILLGKRTNRPAQGYWFVPGGRIIKDETFEQAFERLLKVELGLAPNDVTRTFLGVYQHFYNDNFSDADFSTHYVVLAYEVQLKTTLSSLPAEQHSDYQWMDVERLLNDSNVHKHSQWYFLPDKTADTF